MAGQSVGFVMWRRMSGWRRGARFVNSANPTPHLSKGCVCIYSLAPLKPGFITQLYLSVVCMAYNTLEVLTGGTWMVALILACCVDPPVKFLHSGAINPPIFVGAGVRLHEQDGLVGCF